MHFATILSTCCRSRFVRVNVLPLSGFDYIRYTISWACTNNRRHNTHVVAFELRRLTHKGGRFLQQRTVKHIYIRDRVRFNKRVYPYFAFNQQHDTKKTRNFCI